MISSNVTINKIVMNVKHKDVIGTLDISGYTIKYSAQGNNDSAKLQKLQQLNQRISPIMTFPSIIYNIPIVFTI